MKLKQLFCKHEYKKFAKRQSQYTSDYQYFSDYGWYDDVAYYCTKCGKKIIKVQQNEKHPLYKKWEKVEQ